MSTQQSSILLPLPERLLRRQQVVDLLGVGLRTFERWLATRTFPKPDIRRGRIMLWKISTITAWIETESRKNRRAS
jgi:predicted DNA-binding transcriptional regulator AlpA